MECIICNNKCIKWGTSNGKQRYRCKKCAKTCYHGYSYKAYHPQTNSQITVLLKEGCGIRSISRIMDISAVTVIRRILYMASVIKKPPIAVGKTYEADELKTYLCKKSNEQWVIYAIDRESRKVVDFRVGKRNKRNIEPVIETLLLSGTKCIYTDNLNIYRTLIPKSIHKVKAYHINHIERKNLTLRTHLKRLCRKTICYSKSILMLTACLKIYFWSAIM